MTKINTQGLTMFDDMMKNFADRNGLVVIKTYTDIPDYVPDNERDAIMESIDSGAVNMMPKKNPFDLIEKIFNADREEEDTFGMPLGIMEELSRRRMKAGCQCESCCRRRKEEESELPLSEASEEVLATFRGKLALAEADAESVNKMLETMKKNRRRQGIPENGIKILIETTDVFIEEGFDKV